MRPSRAVKISSWPRKNFLSCVAGQAMVQQIFPHKTKNELYHVAGCRVEQGELDASMVHILVRNEEIIHEGWNVIRND